MDAREPDPSGNGAGDEAAALELDAATAVHLLASGRLELVGRLLSSSNNAMLGTVNGPRSSAGGSAASGDPAGAVGVDGAVDRAASDPAEVAIPCVYKPVRGERPLWDFPDGTLAGREVAAYRLSEALGWSIVPPTVRRSGPFGDGMVQLWLEPDEAVDRVALVVEGDPRLRPIALFDVVANNADRKVGHLLPMPDGHIFGVDHGICFHEEPKLRTVLWRWRGEPLRADELADLRRLRRALDGPLGDELRALVSRAEVAATARRVDDLLSTATFPHPDPDRPAIPWPPY